MFLKITKHLIEIFSKKDTYFKEVLVFHCLLVQIKKEKKMGRNKM